MYKITLNYRLLFPLTVFLIAGLIFSACAPSVVEESVVTRRATRTPTFTPTLTFDPLSSEVPATLEFTQPAPEVFSLPARLSVMSARAQLVRGQGAQDIQPAQAADIQTGDALEIIRLDGQREQSYSILQFPNLVNIELLGSTKFSLLDARQEAGGPAEIVLDLTDGHMFVHLSEAEVIHLSVQTPNAVINTLTPGTDFDVCHTEELTCVMVKRGIVEIVAKDKREVVKAGFAGVVLNSDSPSPAICAPGPIFVLWEERFRLSADAPSLQQEIAALPQQACPVRADGYPFNARILYRDEFSRAAKGWQQGQFDVFKAAYARYDGGRYYQVQVQGANAQYLTFVPNKEDFGDVNIDLKTRTETGLADDFRYGVVLRRTGDRYYAFAVSPVTKAWYFFKSSPNGVQVLKEGEAERMRGLEGQDTLRVEASGPLFLLFINNRFIDWISDPEYARGEVGLLVESLENPEALVNFNSIVIWDMPAPDFNPQQGEKCFNAVDDDADGLIDQGDPDCQRPDLIITYPTVPPLPSSTPRVRTSTPQVGTRTPTKPPTLVVIGTTRGPSPTPVPTQTRRPTRTPTNPPPPPTSTDPPPPPTATDPPPPPTPTDPPTYP